MNTLLAMRALLFVGELFLGSTLAMNIAWLAAAAFPRRASLRHLIWLTAFGALLLLPVAALVIPSHIVLQHPVVAAAPPPQAVMTIAMPAAIPDAPLDTDADAAPHAMPPVAMPAPPAAIPVAQPVFSFTLPDWHAPWIAGAILALWFLGLLVNALRGGVAAFGLRVLLRRSVPYTFPAPALPELAQTRCRLRLFTGHGPGPVTWGFVRPVILLPQDAVEWPEDRLTAVLRHEMAHVRRHDSLVQVLSLLVCALYWPNPLVWMGARALRREAELAADDAVLASGITPSVYAGELVRLATEFRGRHVSFSGIGMAGQSALEERVKSVLAASPLRTGVTVMDAVKIACLALTATASLALLRPDIAVAQNQKPSAVTAAPLPPVPATPAREAEAAAPAAPVAPPAPPAPPSVRDDGNHGPTAQEQMARQARHDAQMAADQAKREAEMGKREATQEAAQEAAEAKREAEHEVAEAKREAEQDAAEAKREGEQEGRQAAAEAKREGEQAAVEARREVAEQMVQARAAQHDAEHAIAHAHIGETVTRAMAEAQPQIDAAVRDAMKDAQPQIDKAVASVQPKVQSALIQAKINEIVARALAKAQPQIDAAIARVQATANYRIDIHVDPRNATEPGDPKAPIYPQTKVKPMDE